MRSRKPVRSKKGWLLGGLLVVVSVVYGWSFLLNRDSGGRIAISGQVTHNGAPVDRGRIQFTPDRNTAAPTAAATIVDGTYHIEAIDGLPPGVYETSISVGPRPTMDPNDRLKFPKQKRGQPRLGSNDQPIRWPVPQVIAEGKREVVLNFDLPATSKPAR
jgi:hypothetical protein